MTLKEIAARAGVSVSTVSRVINSPDDSFARREVRERIWDIVRETGYVPNGAARELKTGKSSAVGAKTHTLTCVLGRTLRRDDNPFFASVARAAEQQALDLGYVVTSSYSLFDIDNSALLRKIEDSRTDGAIVLGRFDSGMSRFFSSHYKNLVYVGRNPIDEPWDQVICDGYEATKTAIEHLIAYGHTRIGYIGDTENEVRYQAYRDTVRLRGLDDDMSLVASAAHDGQGGYAGAKQLLERANPLPTAVFCAADVAAIAAMKMFSEADIRVPAQLSVIGLDDIELAAYVSPMLTTVSIPKVELGAVAVRTLVDRIERVHRLPMKIYIPHKLIVRESTAMESIVDKGSYI
ncbi:MAG: LacI family transcriptional regulator [Oscillospiraceae bacterium]|jgi:DNA-binding LacI/PurR family transcriptional regulator|nr:LacI family transcriptional regulator [Oscillospiraceae bacterium]